LTGAEVERQLRLPGSDPLVDSILALTSSGNIVGAGRIVLIPESGRVMSIGAVHPHFRRQGIGSHLVQWCDARAVACAESAVPAEVTLYVQRFANETNTGAKALLAGAGYQPVRYFYTMHRDLDTPLAEPALPPGITLRPFVLGRDAHAVFDAVTDSFSEHWGMGGFDFERWSHTVLEDPRFDPALWLIAMDGDEIAAICLNNAWGADLPDLGWISTLGVRKPWRKRGLGAALLNLSFYQFQQRGWTQARLGVDAENATGAVALYERVGMRVYACRVAYRKILRGDGEIRG
jgi:mycothiol synthase